MSEHMQTALFWAAIGVAYGAFVWLLASCMGHASDVDYDEEEQ